MTSVSTTLDLSKIRISPLSHRLVIKAFDCGDESLNKWICDKSLKHQNSGRARVFCAHEDGGASVFGLYSLTMMTEEVNKLREDERRHLKRGGHFPVIYLQSLAVVRRYQSQGLGTILLMNALSRAFVVSQHVAVFGIALRSLNDSTTKYYEKHGFGVREEGTINPMMVLPIWSLTELMGAPEAGAPSPQV